MSTADRARRERDRGGNRRDLALALTGAFAFGCTILFSRTVAREQLAPGVALGIRIRRRRRHPAGSARRVALAGAPPRGERIRAFALGLCIYAVESTFFYMGLERGTAAAVALIFYAYPAVIAVFETLTGAGFGSGRARSSR